MQTDARAALEAWQASRPANVYDALPTLARGLQAHAGTDVAASLEPRLHALGADVAQVVDPAAALQEQARDYPRLSGSEIEFHPAHDEAGRAVWRHGGVGASAFEQAAQMILLSYAGEAGQGCPFTCTAGLVRALREHGSDELRARFLPPLLETDYEAAHRGAQFLTEVQGGSDVGANETAAIADGDAWRLHGEKWFCSVADADQFVVTGRPRGASDGTAGLGCFLVPRRVDGAPNGFRIRKLKDKLGTRLLATAEIEFDGALAYPIGALEDGFRIAVGSVLNTSRWLNACGSAGLMWRAWLEASSFARHRTAFGRPIADFALVRDTLDAIEAEAQAAQASTLALTALVDRLDRDPGDDEARGLHRFLVNANKFVTSRAATEVVHRAIETLGGNGTIEDFSPLPRLYRDAIVFESWEGTHNVLVEQVRRDAARFELVPLVLADVRSRLDAPVLDELERSTKRALDDPVAFRDLLVQLMRAYQASYVEDVVAV